MTSLTRRQQALIIGIQRNRIEKGWQQIHNSVHQNRPQEKMDLEDLSEAKNPKEKFMKNDGPIETF